MEGDRPREPVGLERPLSEDLGEAAVRGPDRQVQLEEAFAGGHDAMGEPQVRERRRLDRRDAERVARDGDRRLETSDAQLTLGWEEGRCGLGPEGVDELGHDGDGEPIRLAVGLGRDVAWV